MQSGPPARSASLRVDKGANRWQQGKEKSRLITTSLQDVRMRRASSSGARLKSKDVKTGPKDLYELAQPLLDKTSSQEARQRAKNAISEQLKVFPNLIQAWRRRESPLLTAAKADSLDFVELLVEAGVNLQERDVSGLSALHYASLQGCAPIVRALLGKRADVNQRDNAGQTPKCFAMEYFVSEVLLEAKADTQVMKSTGFTPLHHAVNIKGPANSYAVKVLGEAAADINALDSKGSPALFYGRTKEICEQLISLNANLNILNHLGQSILHIAARSGDTELFKMFLATVDKKLVDVVDLNGDSCWEYAELSGLGDRDTHFLSEEAMKSLDETLAFAEDTICLNKRGRKRQVRSGFMSVSHSKAGREGLKMLMEQSGEREKSATRSLTGTMTDLELKELENLKADDLYEVVTPLLNPMSSSEEHLCSFRAAKHLLKRIQVPTTWQGPGTPLSTSVLADRKKLVRLILRAHANPNEKDSKGVPMLHHAAFNGSGDMCQALLAARADVDGRDSQGQTALFFAADCKVCKLLLEYKADASCRDERGAAALHNVARAGLQDVFKLMYSQTDDITHQITDYQGNSIFDYAASAGITAAAIPRHADHAHKRGKRHMRESCLYTSEEGLDVGQMIKRSYTRKKKKRTDAVIHYDEEGTLVGSTAVTDLSPNLTIPGLNGEAKKAFSDHPRVTALRCLSADKPRMSGRGRTITRARSADCSPREARELSRSSDGSSSSDAPSVIQKRVMGSCDAQSMKMVAKRASASVKKWTNASVKKVSRLRDLRTKPPPPRNFLWEVSEPLFDEGCAEEKRMSAMQSLHKHLSKLRGTPDSWSGPGTPLHSAVQAQMLDVVCLILNARATVNIPDASGKTPLHYACADGNSDICEALLATQADANAREAGGNTPLLYATTVDVCQLLVQVRAEVTAVNSSGESALDVAGMCERQDMYAYLLDEMKGSSELVTPMSPGPSVSEAPSVTEAPQVVITSPGKQPPINKVLETHDQLLRDMAAKADVALQAEKKATLVQINAPRQTNTAPAQANTAPAQANLAPAQPINGRAQFPSYLRRLEEAHRQGFPVLLISETDESALRHAIKLCAEQERPEPQTMCITLHSHTTIQELSGHFEITSSHVEFVPGVLTRAVKEGRWLIMSGLNHAPTAVLEFMQDMLVQVFDETDPCNRRFTLSGVESTCEGMLRTKTRPGGPAKKTRKQKSRYSQLLRNAFANSDMESDMPTLNYKVHDHFRFFCTSLKYDLDLPVSFWSHFVTMDFSAEARARPHLRASARMTVAVDTLRLKLRDSEEKDKNDPSFPRSSKLTKDPQQVPLETYRALFDFCDLCYMQNRSGLIIGENGIGKTTAWHSWVSAHSEVKRECMVIRMHAHIDSADLIGAFVSSPSHDQVSRPFVWKDGPVARAAREGHAVLLAGLHHACPSAVHCLAGVLESGDYHKFVINNESVEVHEDFMIFATAKNEESVHPSLRAYFQEFPFQGTVTLADAKRLAHGILGDQLGVDAKGKDFQEKAIEHLWESRKKKYPIGPLARALRRAQNLYNASLPKSFRPGQAEFAKVEYWQECLKLTKVLEKSEPTGVLNIQNIPGPAQSQLKSVVRNSKYDGREDLGHILSILHACKMPAILEGPAGEGKRASARAFVKAVDFQEGAGKSEREFQPLTMTMTRSMASEEIFGQVYRTPGNVEYVRGPFEIAITEGRILIVDRISEGSPDVLAHLVDAVSFPPRVFNPITGNWINVHPDFWFIGLQSLDAMHHQRFILPDELYARAVVIPVGEKDLAQLRYLLEQSDCFPELCKKETKNVVLDELMSAAQKAKERGKQGDKYDFRSCLKILRRLCGNPSSNMSTANPDLAPWMKPDGPVERKTLAGLGRELSRQVDRKVRHFDLSEKAKNEIDSIRRLVQLHLQVFFDHCEGVRYRVDRKIAPVTSEAQWAFTCEEEDVKDPLKISVYFPCSYDTHVDEEIEDLGPGQLALLCQLAFGLRYRENVLLVGPPSFKAHTTNLLSRMMRFEHFLEGAPPLNKPLLSRMSDMDDLFGGFEPHTFHSFARYVQRSIAPLEFQAVQTYQQSTINMQLEELKQLINHLTLSLRKLYLQPGSGTQEGILIAEGHKRMVMRLHQQLASCGLEDHLFVICERGIMPSIRFGGICLLSHVEELGAPVMDALAPLLDIDNKSFRHPLSAGRATNDEYIPVHPQCYFVCTAVSVENLTFTLQNCFTRVFVPKPSAEDISRIFRRSLNLAAKQKNLDGAMIDSLLERLTPVAQSCDSMRQVVWLATLAGVLKVSPKVSVNAVLAEYLMSESLPSRAASSISYQGPPKLQLPTSARWHHLTCFKESKRSQDLWDTVVDCPRSKMMAWHLIAAAECQAHGLPHPYTVFVSQPGCGKTFICEEVARFLGKEFVNINCNANTDIEELFGSYAAVSGTKGKVSFKFKEGALIQAAQKDSVVLFDGINRLQVHVMSAVLAFLRSDSHEGISSMHDFVFDKRKVLFCACMNPEDLREGCMPLLPTATSLLRCVSVDYTEEDVQKIIQAVWDKNLNLATAMACGKVLDLKLRGMLRFMQMLPGQGWQLGDRSEVDATAAALRFSFPTDAAARAKAHKELKLVLSSAEHTKPLSEALSRDMPLPVTPSDVLHAAWPGWAGLSKPGPETKFAYPGFILVSGPPCSGKRTLVRQAAKQVPDMKLLEICMTHETRVSDFIGGVVPTVTQRTIGVNASYASCHFQFVQGQLLWAAQRGYWCLVANADQARPEVLARLNSLGECPPSLNLVEQLCTGINLADAAFKVHPNFRIFFTVSTHENEPSPRLARSFLDRCVNVSLTDGTKEWCAAAEKIGEASEGKTDLGKKLLANHRTLIQQNGPEKYLHWNPECTFMPPTLRGLCRTLQCARNQSEARLHDSVMKGAYGDYIPREFDHGLLVPSRTGDRWNQEENKEDNKGAATLSEEGDEDESSEVPVSRALDMWAELSKEAGTPYIKDYRDACKNQENYSLFKRIERQLKRWQGKVEDFDKAPWRASITVSQLRRFADQHCGRKYEVFDQYLSEMRSRVAAQALSKTAMAAAMQELEDLTPDVFGVAEVCVKPATKIKECSLAQFLNPDGLDVDMYVSHTSSQDFNELVNSIRGYMTDHCANLNASRRLHKNPNDYSLWICAMSLNLHSPQKLPADEPSLENLSFSKVLNARLHGVLLVLDKNFTALSRTWCLYELHYGSRNGLPVDICINSSPKDLASAVNGISVESSETREELEKNLMTADLESFNHSEFGRGHEGVETWTKQAIWDMALRSYTTRHSVWSKEGRDLAEQHDADPQMSGISGQCLVEPMEVKNMNRRVRLCRPFVQAVARTLLRKRMPTNPMVVVIDNAFLGLGLHPEGAQCIGDLIVVILCVMASIRVDFEVISAGDESCPPRLLKAVDEHLPVVWRNLVRGSIGRGHLLTRPIVPRLEVINMLAISAEGRGLMLKLDDVGIGLHEGGIRRLGGINIMKTPGVPAEFAIMDVQRSFKQARPRVLTGPDAMLNLLSSLLLKGSAEMGKQARAHQPVYHASPFIHSEDPFLRERHERSLSDLEAGLSAQDAGSSGVCFLGQIIDEDLLGNEGRGRPKRDKSDTDSRPTIGSYPARAAREGKSKLASEGSNAPENRAVCKRAREVMDKLLQYSTRVTARPGSEKATEALWAQLRDTFEVYVHHASRALLRVSEAENRPHEAKPSVGSAFSLKKIIKFFLMDGAASDMWERRHQSEVEGSVVVVLDCSGVSTPDSARFAAATVFSFEHIDIPFAVVRWDQRGVQLVKPAPSRNKAHVLQELTSAWDNASKSCFLRAVANCQVPPRSRGSPGQQVARPQLSDALLAAASLLIEGDYPAPRRIMLVPQAMEPSDHAALLDAWHYAEEFARAQCISINLCPSAGPLPRSVEIGHEVSPSIFAHVLGSIFSSNTSYVEPRDEKRVMPTWAPQEDERISVLNFLPSTRKTIGNSWFLEYKSRSEEEAKQYHKILRQLAVPYREVDLESYAAAPINTQSEADEDATEEELQSDTFSVTSYGSTNPLGKQFKLRPSVAEGIRSMEEAEKEKVAANRDQMAKLTGDKEMVQMVIQIQKKIKSASYDRGGVNWLKVFREVDKDRSGEIDFDEFCIAIRRSGKIPKNAMSDQDLRLIFDFVDVDGSGMVDYETEFVPWMQADLGMKKAKGRGPMPAPETVFMIKGKLMKAASDMGGVNWSKIFKNFDKDNSGTLDRAEFKMVIRRGAKIYETRVPDQELDLLFNYIDQDGSGTVNYENEFLTWLQPQEIDEEEEEEEAEEEKGASKSSVAAGKMPGESFIKEIKRKMKAAAYHRGKADWARFLAHYDKDNSRTWDFEEFSTALRKSTKISAKILSDKELMALFQHIDKHGHKSIEIIELGNWIQGTDDAADADGETTDGSTPSRTSSKGSARRSVKKAVKVQKPESSGLAESPAPVTEPATAEGVESSSPGMKKTISDSATISDSQIKQIKRKLKAAAYNQGGVDWAKSFKEFDTDKSGFLDIDEFKPAIRKTGKIPAKVLPDRELQALFNYIDDDGSKTIHVTEFVNWIEEKAVAKNPSPFLDLLDQIKSRVLYAASDSNPDWKALFVEFDRPGHGRVKYEDWRALIRRGAKVKPTQVNDEDLKFLFDGINWQGDPRGVLYENEFLPWLCPEDASSKRRKKPLTAEEQEQRRQAMQKDLPSDALLNQIQRKLKSASYTAGGVDWDKLFREVDRDRSGLIDYDEFHKCIRKCAKITKNVLSDKDVRALFDYIDKDGSNEVEYKTEFLPWAQEGEDEEKSDAAPAPELSPEELAEQADRASQAESIKQRMRAAADERGCIDWEKVFKDLGKANFQEFQAAIRSQAKLSKQVITDGELRRAFDYHDVHKEGRVDLQSMVVPWLKPQMEKVASEGKLKKGTMPKAMAMSDVDDLPSSI